MSSKGLRHHPSSASWLCMPTAGKPGLVENAFFKIVFSNTFITEDVKATR